MSLRVVPSAPEGEGVVDVLERALAEARTGRYSSVVVCFVDREGCTGHAWSKLHSRSTMIGGMVRTQHAMTIDG